MKYSEIYIKTHDIDWFCKINGKFVHVASGGGAIPQEINNREKNDGFVCQVAELPPLNIPNVGINVEYICKHVLEENVNQSFYQYIQSFVQVAKKGFYSFDKTLIKNQEDSRYHLVAWPLLCDENDAIKLNQLNLPLFSLPQINFDEVVTLTDIDLVEIIDSCMK